MTENRHLPKRSPCKCAALAVAGWVLAAWSIHGALAGTRAGIPRTGVESVEAIREAAAQYVRSQLPAAEVASISAGSLDDRLRLARCATALSVEPIAGTQSMANSTISVSCARPAHWKVFVPVTVVRHVPVLILRRAVARGAHLTSNDVLVQMREVTGFAAPLLASPAQLGGRSTDRTLAAGTALTADMFTLDPVISRGQDVTLVVQADGLEVRAAGQALDDARRGQRLRVENLSSRKVVQGIARSSGVVEVGD
jgi:flagellar basal body P-ring formation protein FlgA